MDEYQELIDYLLKQCEVAGFASPRSKKSAWLHEQLSSLVLLYPR